MVQQLTYNCTFCSSASAMQQSATLISVLLHKDSGDTSIESSPQHWARDKHVTNMTVYSPAEFTDSKRFGLGKVGVTGVYISSGSVTDITGLVLTGLGWMTLTGAEVVGVAKCCSRSWYSRRSILLPRLGWGGSQVVMCWYIANKLSPRHFQLKERTWQPSQVQLGRTVYTTLSSIMQHNILNAA